MSFENKTIEDKRIEAELEVMKSELAWLLDTEIPRLATVVDDLMKKCHDKLAPFSIPSSLQTPPAACRPLLLNTHQLGDTIKGHVTVSGDKISKAEVTLKVPGRAPNKIVKIHIREHEAWKLQQIQNTCNHFSVAQNKCPSMSERLNKLKDPKSILLAVSEISAIIQLSMDSLVVPTTPSLGEIFSINRQKALRPELPDDILLNFHIVSDHLMLTIYILGHTTSSRASQSALPGLSQMKEQAKNADKSSAGETFTFEHNSQTYEVVNQLQVRTPVPWLSEVLAIMEEIVEVCQEISDKVRGFDIPELSKPIDI